MKINKKLIYALLIITVFLLSGCENKNSTITSTKDLNSPNFVLGGTAGTAAVDML